MNSGDDPTPLRPPWAATIAAYRPERSPGATSLAVGAVSASTLDPQTQQVRLALRVVIHLHRLGPLLPDDTARPESTQRGMARSLGVTQGAVSKVLARLAAVDVVGHARHHVRGESRRMQAYFLTARGAYLASQGVQRFPNPNVLA